MSKPEVLKAKDVCDSFVVKKSLLPNVPFRMLIIGRSGSGKSSILSCAVALPSWYGNDFEGDNIYIFTGSPGDDKMERLIEFKEIPNGNIFKDWNDSEVSMIYDDMVEDWNEAVKEGKRPKDTLFIIDDLSFTNKFRSENAKNSMMNKLYQNARKFNGSVIVTAQKYSSIATPVRENANCLISFSATNKQMALMEADFNYLPSSKDFEKVFREATNEKHGFLFVNVDAPMNMRYLNNKFESLINSKN